MDISTGIGLAFVAMFAWGIGDFYIQRSTRKVGDWETLFFISLVGAAIVLPFVYKDIPSLIFGDYAPLLILLGASVVIFVAALIDFEALKRGKIAMVEPIWSLEVPVSALLAFFLLGERLSWYNVILIAGLLVCLTMVAVREKKISKSFFMEKGAWLALLGAIVMGSANFVMGWGGRVTDPLMVNFVTDLFMTISTAIYIIARGKVRTTITDVVKHYAILIPMSILDKIAWVAYVFAMSLAPIGIVTALSQSYIIISVMLGIVISKEKMQMHQKFGLVGAVVLAIIIAVNLPG